MDIVSKSKNNNIVHAKTSLSKVSSEITCCFSRDIITVILYLICVHTVRLYRDLNFNLYIQKYFYQQY